MKNKYFILLISIMIVIVGFASAVSASNWTQFQTDEKHTGVTDDNGPDDGSISINYSKAVGNGMIDTVPLVLGDYVYVEGASKLSKYNKNSGDFVVNLTVAETGGYIIQNACPASDGNDTIFVVDTGYGNKLPKIKAISASSMTQKWSTTFSNGANQCSCPVTYYNDSGVGKLFVGTVNMSKTDPVNLSDDGSYYAFYADNGTEIWNRPTTTGGGYYWAGAAVVGGFLVYPDDAGTLTSVYISNGTRANETDLSSNQIRSSATYNANDHLIYVAGKDGYVRSVEINPSTGIFGASQSYAMSGSSTSTPAYNAADHKIYAASGSYQHGYVYCFNATTLDLIWTSDDLQHLIQSSPAVADDGVNNSLIFVTDNDATGMVYRIEDLDTDSTFTSLQPSSGNTYSLAGVAISGDYAYFGNDNGYLYQVK
jgi:outer membrane protein assembly factor BamB